MLALFVLITKVMGLDMSLCAFRLFVNCVYHNIVNLIQAMNHFVFLLLIAVQIVAPQKALANKDIQSSNSITSLNSELVETTIEATTSEKALDLTITLHDSTEFLVRAPSKEEQKIFTQLSEADQEQFLKNRQLFLELMAKSLKGLKYGFGIGSLVKSKLTFKKENSIETQPENPFKLTLADRSQRALNSLLEAADKKFWSQAQLFSKANEFGFVLSANIVLLGGVQKKFSFGGQFGLGISVGFNLEKKSMVFQFFRDVEKYRDTLLKAVGVMGLVGKAGMYIVSDKTALYKTKGTSFYPPAIPGFATETPTKFITGASSGLTLPPWPIGDLLTYTNDLEERTMIKVEVSPTAKGFIYVKTEKPKTLIKLILYSVKASALRFVDQFRMRSSCQALFN